MVRRHPALLLEVAKVYVELNRGLDGFDDDRVAALLVNAKTRQNCHRPWGGNTGLLEILEAEEFEHRGAAPAPTAEAVAQLMQRVFMAFADKT